MRAHTTALEPVTTTEPADRPLDVLTIEDSPSDAAVIRAALTFGHADTRVVRWETSLSAGLAAIANKVPDCILLDLGLPDSDGLNTLDAAVDAAPNSAIVVLTGFDDDRLGHAAVQRGAQDYLVKGRSDAELLCRAVGYAVTRKQAERAAHDAEREFSEAMHASEKRFAALIENSSDILAIVNANGVFEFASPALARVLGDQSSLAGTAVADLVHPDDRATLAATLASTLDRPGRGPAVTVRVQHTSGAWRWLEAIPNNQLDEPAIKGIVVNARDITESRHTVIELERLNRVLRTVTEADAVVVHAATEDDLLAHMCRVIVDTGGYAVAWIAAADPAEPGRVVPTASYGLTAGHRDRLRAAYRSGPADDSLAATAILTGCTQVVQDLRSLAPGSPLRELSLEYGLRSQLVLPLLTGETVMGALSIQAFDLDAFVDDEVELLRQLAADLSYGVTSLRARAAQVGYVSKLQRNLDALVGTIAAASEARDPYIGGHQHRVALLATAIARELAMDDDTVSGIAVAASIHDIGKISVPAEILSKPGSLSGHELGIIEHHVQAGFDIIKRIDFPWPVARMVLEHHERLDGSGYPSGLRDEILIGSRIVAVADVVEAMASHRPYRPALGIDAALAQIIEERGVKLDAAVVDACVRLFTTGRFHFDAAQGDTTARPPRVSC